VNEAQHLLKIFEQEQRDKELEKVTAKQLRASNKLLCDKLDAARKQRAATKREEKVERDRLKGKTPHTARTQFLELPSRKRANTPARGCNALYRPSRVPLRRSGTCRAAVAALAGTDQQTLRASYLE
jgi:hypothetical protein